MDYENTIKYLFNIAPAFERIGTGAYKEGLDNTLALDERYGHPHMKFKTIHIAGTNGKGSCSHTLASILQKEGYKVGLYTSPHLFDFRERIRVNGHCIEKSYIVDFIENDKHFFEQIHPSFFEVTTALAFKYFAEQGVDIAVIEVGLGGRLDCTNIITPLLSVITNISLDHTALLGNTLPQIATEKAGIIKRGIPVVIGESTPETKEVFIRKANEQNADIVFAEENNEIRSSVTDNGITTYNTAHFGIVRSKLCGSYQMKNTNTVLNVVAVLKRLGILNDDRHIREGIFDVCEETGLNGRWQQIGKSPRTVCDTGHNLGAWQYLAPQIKAQKCKNLRIVFGMVDDKDIDGVMRLLPANAIYYFTKASTKRAIDENTVKQKAESHHLQGETFENVEKAFDQAMEDAEPDDFVFVGGSSYVVADLITSIKDRPEYEHAFFKLPSD